ncbi:allantoate permease, putative [Talaromyces stipitatus ATCC 10500]|uniref:Allantoate permease, putative n=1 Tax=Talaromyces stipitatus (strain ATCC 10500 / CBS 375.48 / QM 6759 / NRRL 1006) TaxID=441959 RepID=B8MLP1_TALSN|nr:allantoate permease, putative [Talaromyces stipitatus ATCC 10500]EED13904.1 allantoate permease, putative [Talaromyces stipitatus ATCC 10500]
MASVVPTIAGVIVLLTVPFAPSKRVGLLLAYYIIIAYWGCAGLALSLVTRNVAVGNAIGSQTYQAKDAPRYFPALATVLVCFVLLEVVLFALRTYYIAQNKKRDCMIERGEATEDRNFTHSFEDITDRQNVNFDRD